VKQRDHIELIRIGELDEKDKLTIYPNITDDRGTDRSFMPFYEPEIYKEFKLVEEYGYTIQQRNLFVSRGNEYRRGKEYHGLKVDTGLTLIGDNLQNGIRTSIIKRIVTENLFITLNSVYFLRTPEWRKRLNRHNIIGNILDNGKST